MNKKAWKLLKGIDLAKFMLVVLLLRAPFDLVRAITNANLLEQFLRIAEKGEGEKLMSTFLFFLVCFLLLFAYNMTIWMTISVTGTVTMQKRLRKKMLRTILDKPYEKVREQSNGHWINRLGSDIDIACNYVTGPLNFLHLFIASICFVGSGILLFRQNIPLFVLSMSVTLPFSFLSCVVIIRNVGKYKKNAQSKLEEFTNWVEPAINAHPSIQVFEGEEFVLKKVEETSLSILKENMKGHRRMAASSLCNIFSGNLGYLLLLFVGNSMIGVGIKDVAMLMKITQYRGEMMRNIMMANNCIGNMRTNLAGVERVEEVLTGEERTVS